jgi:hypothetical protein
VTDDQAIRQLAQECPCRIMGLLHAQGHYVHCTSARFPGKVLCFRKDSELPGDCIPTPAQEHFWQSGQPGARDATG